MSADVRTRLGRSRDVETESSDLPTDRESPVQRRRFERPSTRSWVMIIVGASAVLCFLYSYNVDRGFGYTFAQCLYKAHHSLDTYSKSQQQFENVTAIISSASLGWASIEFPTDKATRHNYTVAYDVLMEKYRNTATNVLELGIKKGGSIKIWREYFNASTFIYGMDIDPGCPTFPNDAHIKSLIVDSTSKKKVNAALGNMKFDVIVDDGCHTSKCIWKSFKALFPRLHRHGLYVIEDYPKWDMKTIREHILQDGEEKNQVYMINDRADDEVLLIVAYPQSLVLTPEVAEKLAWTKVKKKERCQSWLGSVGKVGVGFATLFSQPRFVYCMFLV